MQSFPTYQARGIPELTMNGLKSVIVGIKYRGNGYSPNKPPLHDLRTYRNDLRRLKNTELLL